LAWFQANSQFLWQWWYAAEATGSLWSAKMLGFGLGTIIFAAISYLLKEEGITIKTAICLLLSTAIILIQVLWRD